MRITGGVAEYQIPHPKAGKRAVFIEIRDDNSSLKFEMWCSAEEAELLAEQFRQAAVHARGKLIVADGGVNLPPA